MSANSSRGILTLPLELHLSIIQELQAPDVLSLGQTCHTIRSAVNQRRVWETALRTTCRLNQLFEPSYYPIEDLDILELQRAALEPWRRSASFTPGTPRDNPSEHEGSATSRNTLQKEIALDIGSDQLQVDFESVHIVPGGRYVLGMTSKYICLWDMGQTSKVSWNIRPDRLAPCSIVWAPHGTNFRAMSEPKAVNITSFRFASENETDLHVYEVGPLPDVGSIREIAKLEVCDLIEGMVVWDFVESRYIAIQSRSSAEVNWNLKKTTNGNKVIAWVGQNVGVWTIPPLKPLESSSVMLRGLLSEDCTDFIDFSTIYERDDGPTRYRICLPSHWYSFPPDALEYALLEKAEKTVRVERFLLDVTPTPGAATPFLMTRISSSQPMNSMYAPQKWRPYSTICGSLATMIDYPRAGIVHSAGDADRRVESMDGIQYAFKDLGALDLAAYCFCPPTGRVAYIPNERTSHNGITVVSLVY
ncbi:hypothetical protein DFP72DRAFT_1040278 [Ephemerocybe angulata]|uniref:F-box domain-containing protein n=1 Tax=Ephemerocybe angulata TaxID=980116 RepID=A0A8H6IHN4_9AGAR|nr:hypothetical protein DFP72DRAFT_1040278 [Tulosesus angulatus]